MGPFFAGVALLWRRPLWPERKAWAGIAVGGGLTIAAFNFCTAFAQLSTTTSRAAVLTYTMPMMAAVLAWLLLGERLGRRTLLALGLGAAGIGVLAWPVLAGWATSSSASSRGLLLPLLAAFAWAAGTVLSKRWPPVGERIVITAWQLAVGGGCGIVAAVVSGERWPSMWPAPVVGALVFHIVIATALAYVLWYRLLDALSATVTSLTVLAVPVVGVVGAMLLVGDRPGLLDGAGFVLVLLGAALAMLPRRSA